MLKLASSSAVFLMKYMTCQSMVHVICTYIRIPD